MKYSVGLPKADSDFVSSIIKNKSHISEVYFSWGDFPGGRSMQIESDLYSEWELYEIQKKALEIISSNKIPLNLLFNATCYGDDSLSRKFYNKIGDTIDYIKNNYGKLSVTTTSYLIGKFIKQNFSDVPVRASVNMEIGTIEGMDYIADYLDGYYMKREYNRNIKVIEEQKKWCDENGKTLYILANSGCLNNCSAHTFHDNLVAHEREIAKKDNCYVFDGICHEYLKNKEKWISLIKNTNFIRPEDIYLYEPYFKSVKLATRVNKNPSLVLESYINNTYKGNVLEILEPDHSKSLYPFIIDNEKISNDYIFCNKDCNNCSLCMKNLKNSLVNLNEYYSYK